MSAHDKTLYLEKLTVSFDGFKALNELTLQIEPGRVAMHHRAERRRQDHDDGRHHRQNSPGFGNGAFGPDLNLLHLSEPEIAQAGIGRKFQKPTVFEQLTVSKTWNSRWPATSLS